MIKVVFYRPELGSTNQPVLPLAEYKISNVKINRSIKSFANFEFEIQSRDIHTSFNITESNLAVIAKIYKDDRFIIEGYVVKANYQKESILVSCEDILYALSWVATGEYTTALGKAWIFYRNVQPVVILRDYLVTASAYEPLGTTGTDNFNIGNFFHWPECIFQTNFDAREERTVSDVIYKLADTQHNLYFSYGGYRGSFYSDTNGLAHRVDIGTFERDLHFTFDENNILELDIEKDHEPQLRSIYIYGDTYEAPAGTVNVLHSSSGTVGNTVTDYVVTISGINSRVTKTSAGAEYTKTVTEVVDVRTEDKITPTVAQLNEASQGLYNEAVKKLQEQGIDDIVLNISSNQFPQNIMPGNIVRVKYDGSYRNYNSITQKIETFDMGRMAIDDNFYVQEYSLDLKEGEDNIQLVLINNQNFKDSEPIKVTKKQFKTIKKNKEFFVLGNKATFGVAGLYDLTIGTGLAADTTINGNPARTRTVTKLTEADFGGLTNVLNTSPVFAYHACSEFDEIINIDFEVPPAAGSTTFRISVQVNDNWTTNDQVRVKLLVFFDV